MRVIGRLGKYLFTILLSIILLFNLYGIYQRKIHHQQFPMAFGFGYAIVSSGSMEPTLSWGDLIVVQRKGSYQAADIVTFAQPEDKYPITHRIVSINEESIVTKGDANTSSDLPIHNEQIFGKVILIIPFIGNLLKVISSPLGIMLLVILLLLSFYFRKLE
ncbi:signal peptidase I [Candidatus Enterococcus ferrettii]|uniref:Signal peptidase I n=1 Tax=Candidatus Enterococcus ferrettii TaxID=2815324 RepID=A0ABV0EUC4_9ENTE|nr:signal peptidase I [Enterococcus sp. 665A]MBO1339459.1 signal peptidase I [Enterococcus sp. 665A]